MTTTTTMTTIPATFRLDSPPVLQHPTPDGVTVVWAVSAAATGWVEFGPTPALGRRAQPASCGLVTVAERFLSVRLRGLTPGEPLFYRVVAVPIVYHDTYDIARGDAVVGPVYRYIPPSAATDRASFAVLNDTHENEPTLRALTAALAHDPPDVTVWNGDVCSKVLCGEQFGRAALAPAGAAYAAERPVLFVPGNHDHRGVAARALPGAFPHWPGQDPAVPWCFAVRVGPVALVGLDTGEDKPDHHPAWAGLAAFEPYRAAQRDWLAGALRRPEIASAPHLVVFAHIPLRGLPGENPGDTLEGYAKYSRHSQQLWHPLLVEAGAQVVISGHTHLSRYDAPTPEYPYAQLVGGGPKPEDATLIRGRADAERLELIAIGADGLERGRQSFPPRRAIMR